MSHTAAELFRSRLYFSLAILCALIGSSAPSPLYHLYQSQWGFSSLTLTALFAVYVLGVLLALSLLGRISDRLPDRRWIIVPALSTVAMGSMVLASAGSLEALFLGRLLAGIGTGALTGSANAVLIGLDAKASRRHAPVLATLAFTLGSALGPVLSTVAVAADVWPTVSPFVINAALAIYTAIRLCLIPRSLLVASMVSPRRSDRRRPTFAYAMQGLWGKFGRCSGILMLSWLLGSVVVALGPSMYLFASQPESPRSYVYAGLLVAAFQGIAGIAQYLLRSVPPRRAMSLGASLLCVAWGGSVVGLWFHIPEVFAVGAVVAGVGYGAAFVGAMQAYITLAPADHRATLGSLFYVAGYLGSGLGIIVIGSAADHFGVPGAALCVLLVMLVTMPLLLAFPRKEPKQDKV